LFHVCHSLVTRLSLCETLMGPSGESDRRGATLMGG
jgi:hypothetical protein